MVHFTFYKSVFSFTGRKQFIKFLYYISQLVSILDDIIYAWKFKMQRHTVILSRDLIRFISTFFCVCVHLMHFNELLIMTNNKILFWSDAQQKEKYPRENHLTARSRHDQRMLTSFSSSIAWHASAHQMNQTD